MLDVSSSLNIAGWMTGNELLWLAEQAAAHKNIVEIGSYLGRSTRALCEHTSGMVWAVDDWRGPRDIALTLEQRRAIFGIFLHNMAGCEDRLKIVVADHGNIEIDVEPDMVFIDGDHQYESVRRDIEFWWNRLVPGGLLCGHDINMPGVSKACLELFPDGFVVDDTIIWYQTKPLGQ